VPEGFKLDELLKSVVGYLETRLELVKLEAKEEIAKVLSRILLFTLFMMLLAMLVIISSITLGMYLNYLLDSPYWGMVIISGLYLLFLVFLVFTHNAPFWKRFINRMISPQTSTEEPHD
jgi:uncharacterized membrane protein YqjE